MFRCCCIVLSSVYSCLRIPFFRLGNCENPASGASSHLFASAMAQNYATRPVTRLSDSANGAPDIADMYASMSALPANQFAVNLKDGQFTDIQGF